MGKLDQRLALPRRSLYAPTNQEQPKPDARAVAAVKAVLQDRLPVVTGKEIAVVDDSSKELAEVVNLSLKSVPVGLVERLDQVRGPRSRNEFIKIALAFMVEHVELLTEGQ